MLSLFRFRAPARPVEHGHLATGDLLDHELVLCSRRRGAVRPLADRGMGDAGAGGPLKSPKELGDRHPVAIQVSPQRGNRRGVVHHVPESKLNLHAPQAAVSKVRLDAHLEGL